MSKFDFIIDNLIHSYSSVSSFDNCKYGYKLTYIETLERGSNFFSEFGSTCHSVIQKYFNDKLDYFELSKQFKIEYEKDVVSRPPAFMQNARENYLNKGLLYFDSFNFDKSLYNILLIEEPITIKLENFSMVAKPDLVIQNKETKKNILVDFKTANAYSKTGKLNKKKFKEYMRQFNLYVWALWAGKQIEISEIEVWFITCGKIEKILVDVNEVQENFDWFCDMIEKIKSEETWEANTSDEFFCTQLCSVYSKCWYWNTANKEL